MFTAKTSLISSLLVAASVLATPAAAEGDNWRRKAIDTEQWRENAAIEQGRYKGDLTRREYRQLKAEQERIAAMEKKAYEDGYVSRREFREIREAQADASKHIREETSDGQKSFWRRWLYLNRF
jgi:hypothetical protein